MTLPIIVTMEEAKAFLRLDHDDEDVLVEGFIATATAEALHLADDLDPEAESFPDGIKTAVLLHVEALYDRESGGGVPDASAALARRHRDWSV